MRRQWRTAVSGLIAAVTGLGLAVVGNVGAASAAPTDLFFSEYIEGSSNNKALEIYNGTGTGINLATATYNVQMFFNGSSTAGLTINLTGTVAAGDVFVLAQGSANATILAQADQTNGSGWFNGGAAVVLRKRTTVVDVIGQVGFDPGAEWGTGLTSTADNTLRRKATIEAGDTNGGDAFDPAVQWDGFATDTFGDLGSHLAPPRLTCPAVATDEGTAVDAPVSATDRDGTIVDIAVTAIAPSDPGTITRTAFAPSPSVGQAATATFTASDATPVGAYRLTVVATNSDGVPQTGTCTLSIGVFPVSVCGQPALPIHDVQGAGASTPMQGQIVMIEGIVTGDYQGQGGFGGYYVQDEDGTEDADPNTSEGIFVFDTATDVDPGDVVRVVGFASEFGGQTQVSSVHDTLVCATGASVTPVTLEMPLVGDLASEREPYEGMLVEVDQELTVTEVFTLARFGEVDLSVGGRLETPTNAVAPGGAAMALQDANDRRRILLDDGLNTQNPGSVAYPQGGLSADNTLRVGDTLPGLTGVLGFGFSRYRVQPVGPIEFDHANPRPAAPAEVGGEARVAAFNVLNYFNGDGAGGGFPTPRGANTPFEFDRQRDKIIAAISELDADVLGLMELENDDTGTEYGAVEDLVDGLNDALGAGTYDFIDTGVIGTDAIRVGILYQPARVTPLGDYALIDSTVDSRFDDNLNRPSLAQSFEVNGDGAVFTAVVNHLKSKGSDCNAVGDPDALDGQGNCNLTRTRAAEALVDWLASDPTGSGDSDVILLGDMNSYAQEDPITGFRDAGYVDPIREFVGDDRYSYVFGGQSGYLDHALASPNLAAQVSGVTEWHLNADEPVALDYNTEFKSDEQISDFYSPEPYRASDHDPVLVGLDLVSYDFSGFLPPIAALPAANSVKAGSSVPIKFRLGGDQGLDIFRDGSPTSTPVNCTTLAPTGPAAELQTNGGLTYRSDIDTYSLTWKTTKSWTGCRLLTLELLDGTTQQALFRFAK
jgi:predicted extracellular nuclease